MATTACFIIVSRNDIPIYEAEVGVAAKREDAAQLHQFILHAALDIVQDLAWTTSAMYLKSVDRFNELMVSVLMLLHDSRNDDGIKSFFQEVHELYIKTLLNPLYLPGSRITSSHFDTKVRALARNVEINSALKVVESPQAPENLLSIAELIPKDKRSQLYAGFPYEISIVCDE
ncbi:uncharacterized protein HKW66_Vig0081520 [Vigna angularis]|uniref:Trafficking protein particle complex subunit n=1 Tax=Phaseolus angularis TaxID=3914 RepID=A0A8T0KI37_PHAAN|nr:uncharacterized protein HKW66_Vig0081520 [Vigna angularis]